MPSNFINSKNTEKKDTQQTQGTEKTIYIGVFFDGTGNNKFQVMLGKLFRDKQAISAQSDAKKADGKTMTIGEVRAKGQDYWKNHGTLTESQLDEIFFGYEHTQCGENTFFIEDSIHPADLQSPSNALIDSNLKEAEKDVDLYKKAKKEYESDASHPGYSEKEWKDLKSKLGEGGDIQGSTYTNVAILEALYKSDNNEYFPIYVEGAGTHFDMGPGSGKLTLTFVDAAFGTGPTGVWEKVKKAALAVNRLCQKYVTDNNIIKLHIKMSIYGFSRGATEARMFSFVYNPNKETAQVNKKRGDALDTIFMQEFLSNPKIDKKLNYIGIFDTVSSQGDSDNDVDDLFLYGVQDSDFTFHLCAMDEFRSKFELTDISSAYKKGLELFLPGCHTDVGGGISLGVDDWRLIKRTPLDKMYNTQEEHYVINKWGRSGDSEYFDICLGTLIDMGWLTSKSLNASSEKVINDRRIEIYGSAYEDNDSNIRLKRYVKPGYSNVPLLLMHEKALDNSIPFSSVPTPYQVGKIPLLSNMLNAWRGNLKNKGRKFVSVSNTDYRNLRSQFLHYSGNDSAILSNDPIGGQVNSATYIKLNGASYKRSLITRKIYVGEENSKKCYYLNSISANSAPPEPRQTVMYAKT